MSRSLESGFGGSRSSVVVSFVVDVLDVVLAGNGDWRPREMGVSVNDKLWMEIRHGILTKANRNGKTLERYRKSRNSLGQLCPHRDLLASLLIMCHCPLLLTRILGSEMEGIGVSQTGGNSEALNRARNSGRNRPQR